MTAPAFVTAEMVRGYISLEPSATSRYDDNTLGSNIRAASSWMERHTHRWLWNRTAETYRTTSNGQPYVAIPGLRTATSISQAEASLTVDETAWLVPDPLNTGLFTGVQLRGFDTNRGGPWYLGVPSWFDRNLDSPYWQSHGNRASLPNDIVVVGDWGFVGGTEPEELLHVCKVLAAYFTKRPDALLSGGLTTQDGNIFDLSQFPIEVQSFVATWEIRPMVASA